MRIEKFIILLLICSLSEGYAVSQNLFTSALTQKNDSLKTYSSLKSKITDNSDFNKGKIFIICDSKVDTVMKLQRKAYEKRGGIPGYRVQIFWDNTPSTSRTKAQEIKALYLNKYPHGKKVNLQFEPPFWKVTAGYFRT